MQFFLVNAFSIERLPYVSTEEEALAVLKTLRVERKDGGLDILWNDRGTWNRTDNVHCWISTNLADEIGRIGLEESSLDVRNHPAMRAALDHIRHLESKLEDADKAIREAIREMESVDVEYTEFDVDDHMDDD